MRRDVQLYINSQRVDLFDFEDINIVDTIQDVRDIGKLFLPFSRKFTVPASKNNNKIFNHYYNQDLIDGFDARFKISASIKINGQSYKNGRVTLLGAKLKNDKVYSYNLVFYDGTVDLKSLLGDDLLSDINSPYLDKFTFEYNSTNVLNGLALGYDLVADVLDSTTPIDDVNSPKDLIVPFISTNNYYYYDSNKDGGSPLENDTESRNLNTSQPTDTTVPYGVNWRDLRAGIRLPILIDAIEECYGLTFTGGFFNEANEEFNRLYLFLQKERGLYESHQTTKFTLTDLTLDSGTDQTPLTLLYHTDAGIPKQKFTVSLRITLTDSNDDFTIKVVNTIGNTTIFEDTGKGTTTFNFELTANGIDVLPKVFDLEFTLGESTSSSFGVSLTILNQTKIIFNWQTAFTSVYVDGGVFTGLAETFTVPTNMPKMKIIDFLTGMFNMFNLTAYADLDGNIVVESLDEYYEAGSEIDISKYVDSSYRDVSRNKLYSEIAFEFEKASTFAVLNSNEIGNDEFGNERIDNTNDDPILANLLAFDGGKYEIKPKFEKVQYERMTNQTGGATTDFSWGWLVDKDQKAALVKPFLFYAENVDLVASGSTPAVMSIDFDLLHLPTTKYYRPSNSISKDPLLRQSLNFGSEYDEYYNTLGPNDVSLFTRYWKNYILSIYDKQSRIVSLEAKLPVSIINDVRLNDTLIIRDKKYRINKLDINITTGDTKLELVTWKKIINFYDSDYRADVDVITVDSDLITSDTR